MKVKFVRVNNSIIAITRYAGKTLRASAKCNPEDKFDAATGEKLARARLKVKLAKHRRAWARKQHHLTVMTYNQVHDKLNKILKFYNDTLYEYKEAEKELKELEEKI